MTKKSKAVELPNQEPIKPSSKKKNTNKPIVVLGIDPGQNHTGYSVVEVRSITGKHEVIDYGDFSPANITQKEYNALYKEWGPLVTCEVYEHLVCKLIDRVKPNYIVCESNFFSRLMPNAQKSLILSVHAIQRAARSRGLHVASVTPTEAKASVATGKADKLTVQNSIHQLPDFEIKHNNQRPREKMSEHAADACAIAYAFIKSTLINALQHQSIAK